MLVDALLVWLHLLSAAFWVGGMACMQFAVRPAAGAALEPPPRLAMMSATLGRFFAGVGVAIAVLVASGAALVARAGGWEALPWSVHAMAALGLAMVAVFGHVRYAAYPRVRRAVAAGDFAAAGAALPAIRRLVNLNLALGVLVFAVAVVGRALPATGA
jgi:uncharacterized membrane protein